jgi:hypothetical protein
MADERKADFSDVQGGSSSTAPTERQRTITVQAGDSLSKIAKREYGDASKWHAIFASVHTSGSASNATLTARWTFQDGQQVDERSETISPSGDAYTEFHVSKPGGWPAGNYTLHVLLNGQEIATKNFSVSR